MSKFTSWHDFPVISWYGSWQSHLSVFFSFLLLTGGEIAGISIAGAGLCLVLIGVLIWLKYRKRSGETKVFLETQLALLRLISKSLKWNPKYDSQGHCPTRRNHNLKYLEKILQNKIIVVVIIINSYSSSPNGLWGNSPFGARNDNCLSKIQLVGQKYRDKTTVASKTRFSRRCFGFQSRRFLLLVSHVTFHPKSTVKKLSRLIWVTARVCYSNSNVSL